MNKFGFTLMKERDLDDMIEYTFHHPLEKNKIHFLRFKGTGRFHYSISHNPERSRKFEQQLKDFQKHLEGLFYQEYEVNK